jgi:ketosteroid isomerase-like protein
MIRAVTQELIAVTLMAATLLGAPPAQARDPKPSASDTDGLWKAERTWVRALETADVKLLEGLVDDEFSFIGPDGEYEERGAYLAGYRALPAQGVKVEKVELADVKMRVLGDTAVVTGRALARVKVQTQAIVENVRFTRIYQRRGDGWRMVAGQGTRLAPAAKP